jgi:hypothetical protein
MFEDIVIGWDGGPSATGAVDWVLRRPLGERYVLLTVVDDRESGAHEGPAASVPTEPAQQEPVLDVAGHHVGA